VFGGRYSTLDLHQRLNWYAERSQKIEAEAVRNAGKVPRHELWRLNYYRHPYLLRTEEETLWRRFIHIMSNNWEITKSGQLGFRSSDTVDPSIGEKFTQIIEEWNGRGGSPIDPNREMQKYMGRYFSEDEPIGVKLFLNFNQPKRPILVKYSKREYLEPMLYKGEIRISPASSYDKKNHNDAIRDRETLWDFTIPTYREYARGQTGVWHDNKFFDITHGDLALTMSTPDYYMFCFSHEIDRRLPTDFESDSALIIYDRGKFLRRIKAAFFAARPGWKTIDGDVFYYDPYLDFQKTLQLQMTKHFSYFYQKEYRIVFMTPSPLTEKLDYIKINVGSMTDYAKLVSL
jgi:hypothetical protein